MKSRITTGVRNQLINVSSMGNQNTKSESSILRSLIAVSLIVASLGTISCSSSDNVLVNDPGSLKDVGALDYFPVEDGYTATFLITDENGVDIGSEIYIGQGATTVNGLPGIRWSVSAPSDSNSSESGLIYWDDDAIYHLQDGSDNAEIVLQEPFVYGATWNRWVSVAVDPDTTNINIGNDTPITNDIIDNDTADGGEISLSSFPTKGQSTFYVAATGDDIEVNGETLSGCLQIVNAGAGSTVNRYWYCPGVGLVKYALECEFGSTTGKVNGEKT